MKENWTDIDNNYMISTFGRVKSKDRTQHIKNRWGGVTKRILRGKILKQYETKKGYLYLSLGAKNKHVAVHRLVAASFIQNPYNYPEVNHKDGNKKNNHIFNLEWVSRSQNKYHAFIKGLQPTGENHGRSKLTNNQVLEIKKMLNKKKKKWGKPTYKEIALLYGVDRKTISLIDNGVNWTYLPF